MNHPKLLSVLGFLLLTCTISYAGKPKISAYAEGRAEFKAGDWFDMIVRIDPGGSPIAADGLTVVADAPVGVMVLDALYPAGLSFDKPFLVRIPVKLPAADGGTGFPGGGPGGGSSAKYKVTVRVTGKFMDGTPLKLQGQATLRSTTQLLGHVQGTVKLKEPAVAGKRNAIVLQLNVMETYWVYGAPAEKAGEGAAMFGELLPAHGAKGDRPWKGGGKTMPGGKKYIGDFTFEIPFVPVKAGHTDMRVMINWSACDKTHCDPNEVAYFPVSFDVAEGSGTVEQITVPPSASQTDIGKKSLWDLFVLAIGGGLFALSMPCTYPLIPITISFFTKQAEQRHGNVWGLALAYGVGIVTIFAIIGVVFGQVIVQFASDWPINAVFALLFLVFGLSLIGLFDIRLPGFFNDIAAKASGTGGYFSVVAMGATLVITSFTCTAPIVGFVLVFAGADGALWKVGATMAVFGLTMAIPFVLLALSPKAIQNLPRSGEWMKTLKVTLGIVELGLVLKFVSNVDLAVGTNMIGREMFLWIWGASFLLAGLYLLGVTKLLARGVVWSVGRGSAACGLALLALTGYLYAGASGKLLTPALEAFAPILPDAEHPYLDGFLAVVHEDYEEAIAEATKRGAPIFWDFTGFL